MLRKADKFIVPPPADKQEEPASAAPAQNNQDSECWVLDNSVPVMRRFDVIPARRI